MYVSYTCVLFLLGQVIKSAVNKVLMEGAPNQVVEKIIDNLDNQLTVINQVMPPNKLATKYQM